ncbi:sugar diacid recognition domain-containing protein [Pseudomonas oryzihabitans]|uniref:CdaR family transcriptional regulator n=1 Tax=Pseudomonas oryzihabitans TaxID=47885 RepID=UPI002894A9EB|nr:sugar diacid recognition domain-containing protein [Pseudomonas oryzihabitans]MDT3721691.1 sugar diacid recognition domain-containing protein [Pseudomonas oryzihabitans]
MELSQTLAQEIVERAMRILPGNVNVMDAAGLIIGSGDTRRLFTRHAGAQRVIAEGQAVALDAAAAACLPGAQAGINLPLYRQGELVGVLGVTGEDAEQLRLPAELLRLTAEMLIEQASGHPRADRGMTVTLLRQLLAPEAAPELGRHARLLGLRPELPRDVLLLEFAGPASTFGDWAQRCVPDSWCLPREGGQWLWYRPGSESPKALLAALAAEGWSLQRSAWIAQARPWTGLAQSTGWALDLAAVAKRLEPEPLLATLDELALPTWLQGQARCPEGAWLLEPLERLRQADRDGQLLATLRSWFRHDASPQACAAALGLHRNGLRHRLDRIQALTGRDPRRFGAATELYCALLLADGRWAEGQ